MSLPITHQSPPPNDTIPSRSPTHDLLNLSHLPDSLNLLLRMVLNDELCFIHFAIQCYVHYHNPILLADWLALSSHPHLAALRDAATYIPSLPDYTHVIPKPTTECPSVASPDENGFCNDNESPAFRQRLESSLVHGFSFGAISESKDLSIRSNYPGQLSVWTSSSPSLPTQSSGLSIYGSDSIIVRFVDIHPNQSAILDIDQATVHTSNHYGHNTLRPLAQFSLCADSLRDQGGHILSCFVASLVYCVHIPLNLIARVALHRPHSPTSNFSEFPPTPEDVSQDILILDLAGAPTFSAHSMCPLSRHYSPSEVDDWTPDSAASRSRRWVLIGEYGEFESLVARIPSRHPIALHKPLPLTASVEKWWSWSDWLALGDPLNPQISPASVDRVLKENGLVYSHSYLEFPEHVVANLQIDLGMSAEQYRQMLNSRDLHTRCQILNLLCLYKLLPDNLSQHLPKDLLHSESRTIPPHNHLLGTLKPIFTSCFTDYLNFACTPALLGEVLNNVSIQYLLRKQCASPSTPSSHSSSSAPSSLYYSICLGHNVSRDVQWHCSLCRTCVSNDHYHCWGCNKCVYIPGKSSLPQFRPALEDTTSESPRQPSRVSFANTGSGEGQDKMRRANRMASRMSQQFQYCPNCSHAAVAKSQDGLKLHDPFDQAIEMSVWRSDSFVQSTLDQLSADVVNETVCLAGGVVSTLVNQFISSENESKDELERSGWRIEESLFLVGDESDEDADE